MGGGGVPDCMGVGMGVTSLLNSGSFSACRIFHGVGSPGGPTEGSMSPGDGGGGLAV